MKGRSKQNRLLYSVAQFAGFVGISGEKSAVSTRRLKELNQPGSVIGVENPVGGHRASAV
jgi:hypothetical protein